MQTSPNADHKNFSQKVFSVLNTKNGVVISGSTRMKLSNEKLTEIPISQCN